MTEARPDWNLSPNTVAAVEDAWDSTRLGMPPGEVMQTMIHRLHRDALYELLQKSLFKPTFKLWFNAEEDPADIVRRDYLLTTLFELSGLEDIKDAYGKSYDVIEMLAFARTLRRHSVDEIFRALRGNIEESKFGALTQQFRAPDYAALELRILSNSASGEVQALFDKIRDLTGLDNMETVAQTSIDMLRDCVESTDDAGRTPISESEQHFMVLRDRAIDRLFNLVGLDVAGVNACEDLYKHMLQQLLHGMSPLGIYDALRDALPPDKFERVSVICSQGPAAGARKVAVSEDPSAIEEAVDMAVEIVRAHPQVFRKAAQDAGIRFTESRPIAKVETPFSSHQEAIDRLQALVGGLDLEAIALMDQDQLRNRVHEGTETRRLRGLAKERGERVHALEKLLGQTIGHQFWSRTTTVEEVTAMVEKSIAGRREACHGIIDTLHRASRLAHWADLLDLPGIAAKQTRGDLQMSPTEITGLVVDQLTTIARILDEARDEGGYALVFGPDLDDDEDD